MHKDTTPFLSVAHRLSLSLSLITMCRPRRCGSLLTCESCHGGTESRTDSLTAKLRQHKDRHGSGYRRLSQTEMWAGAQPEKVHERRNVNQMEGMET